MVPKGVFKILLLAVIFSVMVSLPAVAEDTISEDGGSDVSGSADSDLFTLMESNIEIYNGNISSVPSFVINLIDDKEILFIITLEDGSELNVHGATDEDGVFETFEEIDDISGFDDVLIVKSDESTAREIMASSDPAYTLRLALKEKTVIVENAGLFEGIVLWFAKSSLADILF